MTPVEKPAGHANPNVAAVIAYLGGAFTGIMFLLIEKDDRFVRFHAMQSTVMFVAVAVAHLVLRGLPLVGWYLTIPFVLAVVALWIFLMVQAFNGKKYKLPYIGDFAEQLLK
jgi:uncharacterized membrane protein